MALSELVKEVEKRAGIKQVTIYEAIHRLDLVELQPSPKHSRRKIVKYLGVTTKTQGLRKTIREIINPWFAHF